VSQVVQHVRSSGSSTIETALTAALAEKERRARWRANPLDYIVERLKVPRETLDWSLIPQYRNHKWDGDPNPYVKVSNALGAWRHCGVESAVGVGKTFYGACAVLWFLESFENSMVVTTAPKREQLALHIWKEISRLHPTYGKGELQGALKLKMRPLLPLDEWQAVGFVAGVRTEEVESSASRARGFHGEHLLFIFEETPGIHTAVMNAIQDTCVAPHNLMLAFGNPDHHLDTLHKFCVQSNVEHVRISGYDYPNVVLNDPSFVPGAQTREKLDELLERYGGDTARLYMSRARGISSGQAADALIRWEWCEAAARRAIEDAERGPHALGIDVARSEGGDKAAIARGEGGRLVEVDSFPCSDVVELAGQIQSVVAMFKMDGRFVGIDAVGVGGGTIDALKPYNTYATGIVSGTKAVPVFGDDGQLVTETFPNLRSQMWWQMRKDLQYPEKSGIVLPYDEELFADLCSPRFTEKGEKHVVVEEKEAIKKRLGRSPDKGDAVVYWNWIRRDRAAPVYSFSVMSR
jgi:hypothetical protein